MARALPRPLSVRTLHGVALLLAQNVGSRLVGFGTQLVLAWFLVPADFGLVGLAGVVTNFVATLQGFGVEEVLLQRSRTARFWVRQAFWISVCLGLLSGLLVLASAPAAALLFKSDKLASMLAILALSMPLGALATVPNALLRGEMRFGLLAAYAAVENVVLSLATVFLAWRGYGAYSFVLPIPVLGAVKSAFFWSTAKYPSRPRSRRGSWTLLFGSSVALFWSRVINNGIGQGDYFLLGLFASHAVVGVYYFAFRLASQPILLLAANVNAVIYPALVQLKNSPSQQCAAALKAAALLNYPVMFLAFLQAALARPLIEVFFGAKWRDAILLVELLSVGLAFDAVSWIAGSLLGAKGEFVRSARYIAILGSFFFIFVGAGAYMGAAVGTALGVCAYYIITQPIYTYCVFRSCRVPLHGVVVLYFKPSVIAATAVGVGTALAGLPIIDGARAIQATVIGLGSISAYLCLLRVSAPEIIEECQLRICHAIRGRQPVPRDLV